MQHATTTEILSTARGPLVDPHVAVWGWEIPVYLFLGGWTAGISSASRRGPWSRASACRADSTRSPAFAR